MSGREALNKIIREVSRTRRCDYSLVLTDLSMPGMDGYKFSSQLRKKLAGLDIPREN